MSPAPLPPEDIVDEIRALRLQISTEQFLIALLLIGGWRPGPWHGAWTHPVRFQVGETIEAAIQRQREYENQTSARAGAG